MRHLVLGVPARNEAPTIATLAGRLERGAALVGEVATTTLVLAYQTSEDDTLVRWRDRPHRIRQDVVEAEPGAAGKGRNVKLLVQYCLDHDADLLLVDADLGHYDPFNVARFVSAAYGAGFDLVLPLWCRPWGHANSTNYLASPMLRGLYGARIRQPLAGQMFISRSHLETLDLVGLPDDYGVDVALTMSALDRGGRVGQVRLPWISNDSRTFNSEVIMREVATALLARVSKGARSRRCDVRWPEHYWDDLSWPVDPAEVEDHPDRWNALAIRNESPSSAEAWCGALAGAVRAVEQGFTVNETVADLVGPFFAHAYARRRQPPPSVAEAENYVHMLGDELARALR